MALHGHLLEPGNQAAALAALADDIVRCRRCPRLVEYIAEVARTKRRAYADWNYWGRPVPSLGDPYAQLLIVGLAPAAHGANRTGRMFTGDSSAELAPPGAVPGRLFQSADQHPPGRRTHPHRGVHYRGVPLRAAAKQAVRGGNPQLQRLSYSGIGRASDSSGHPVPRADRLRQRAAAHAGPGLGLARHGERIRGGARLGPLDEAPFSPRRRVRVARRIGAPAPRVVGQLPSEPAKHEHRRADGAYVRGSVPAGPAAV